MLGHMIHVTQETGQPGEWIAKWILRNEFCMLKCLCAFNIFALIVSNKTSLSQALGRAEGGHYPGRMASSAENWRNLRACLLKWITQNRSA